MSAWGQGNKSILFPQKFDSVVSNAASTGAKIGLLDSTQSNIYNESTPAHHKIIVHLRGCDTSNSRQDSLLMASTPQVESHLTPPFSVWTSIVLQLGWNKPFGWNLTDFTCQSQSEAIQQRSRKYSRSNKAQKIGGDVVVELFWVCCCMCCIESRFHFQNVIPGECPLLTSRTFLHEEPLTARFFCFQGEKLLLATSHSESVLLSLEKCLKMLRSASRKCWQQYCAAFLLVGPLSFTQSRS